MLFALAGKQINRDVYDHEGFDRDVYKKAFQAALNGQDLHRSAFSMWSDNIIKIDITLKDAQSIVKTIVKETPEVKEHFFKDFGVKLQSLESRMIVEIIKSCMSRRIPVLTIHDSVIVPEQHEVFAHDTMKRVFEEVFPEFTCRVSRKW